jgi:uncharacterized membrane protein YkoI
MVMTKSIVVLAVAALAIGARVSKPAELLKSAKLSLTEAVDKAVPEVKDGSPFSARLTDKGGRLVYLVRFAQGESSVKLSVDAKTSEIVERTTEKKSHSKVASAAKISPAKAIEAALGKVPGKASRVTFGLKKGAPVAEVIVVKDGKLFEVKVNGTTGAVTKVDEDDDDEDGDDDDDDDDEDDDD